MARVRPASAARAARPGGRGEIELGILVTAAHGLDTGWMDRASCRQWTQGCCKPTPWQVDITKDVDGVSGRELIKMALMFCHSCTAQYDCAEYAVRGSMCYGTWGMQIADLEWLQRQPDWEQIIDGARERDEPTQTVVAIARRGVSS